MELFAISLPLAIILLASLPLAILTGRVAKSKGADDVGWFWAGLALGPFALLAAVGLADRKLHRLLAASAGGPPPLPPAPPSSRKSPSLPQL